MAKKLSKKTGYIDIYLEKHGAFSTIFRKVGLVSEEPPIAMLRQLMSNERARMIHAIEREKPKSIYSLAKYLGRDFKAVKTDITLLKRFGIIDLEEVKEKGRKSLKPVLKLTDLQINLHF
jgi:predicted transcriptional regulator